MNRQSVRKTVITACIVLAVGLGIASLLLIAYLADNRLPIIGRLGAYGSYSYFANHARAIFLSLQIGCYAVFLIGYYLNRRWRVFADPLERLAAKRGYGIPQNNADE